MATATVPKPSPAPKKRVTFLIPFVLCTGLSVPGLWVALATANPRDDADALAGVFVWIVLWPLLLICFITIPLAVIFGLLFIMRIKDLTSKLIAGGVVLGLGGFVTYVLAVWHSLSVPR